MTKELKLISGRLLVLRELREFGTYEGVLEGLPTKEKNRKLLAWLRQEYVYARYAVSPLLLMPVEREIAMPEGEIYPFGTPAALPSITCIGRFESRSPTIAGEGDASGLVVIWFQEHFQYPPPSEIVECLESIEWEKYAGNFEY